MNSTLLLPGVRWVQAMNDPNDPATLPTVGTHERSDMSMSRLRYAGCSGILRTYATVECSLLSLHAVAIDREPRRTLIHADKGDTSLPFQVLSYEQYLSDSSCREIGDVARLSCLLY